MIYTCTYHVFIQIHGIYMLYRSYIHGIYMVFKAKPRTNHGQTMDEPKPSTIRIVFGIRTKNLIRVC